MIDRYGFKYLAIPTDTIVNVGGKAFTRRTIQVVSIGRQRARALFGRGRQGRVNRKAARREARAGGDVT